MSAAIDTLIGDVTTMITKKNTGTAIAGTGTNEMISWNMTDIETIDVKGTVISGGIRSEGFSAEKSAVRQHEIATQHRHQITRKQKTTTG